MNATLENVMKQSYETMEIQEDVNAIPSDTDYVFGYRFYELTVLPPYLNIHLGITDDTGANKIHHNLQINTALVLTAGGKTRIYFFLAMIIHRGIGPHAGHYTALVFNNKTGSNFNYTYYDDSTLITYPTPGYSIPDTTKIIPNSMYIKNPLDTVYLLLYADINFL